MIVLHSLRIQSLEICENLRSNNPHSLYQSGSRSMQGERKADRGPRAQTSQREGVRAYSSFGKEDDK